MPRLAKQKYFFYPSSALQELTLSGSVCDADIEEYILLKLECYHVVNAKKPEEKSRQRFLTMFLNKFVYRSTVQH